MKIATFSLEKRLTTILDKFDKLQRARVKLKEIYSTEFLDVLLAQAVGNDRFKRVPNQDISVGDIVLIKDPLPNPLTFPKQLWLRP